MSPFEALGWIVVALISFWALAWVAIIGGIAVLAGIERFQNNRRRKALRKR